MEKNIDVKPLEEEKEKKRRKLIFWWFFGILFFGGGLGVFAAMAQSEPIDQTPVLDITLNEITLENNDKSLLEYESSLLDNRLTWTSLDTTIVEVVNGNLVAKGPGVTQVTVSGKNGLIADTIIVTVLPDEIITETFTVKMGETDYEFTSPIQLKDIEVPQIDGKKAYLFSDPNFETLLSPDTLISSDITIFIEYRNLTYTLNLIDESGATLNSWELENNEPLSNVLTTDIEKLVGYFINIDACNEGIDLSQTLDDDLTVTRVLRSNAHGQSLPCWSGSIISMVPHIQYWLSYTD